jgi:hypothetical protein
MFELYQKFRILLVSNTDSPTHGAKYTGVLSARQRISWFIWVYSIHKREVERARTGASLGLVAGSCVPVVRAFYFALLLFNASSHGAKHTGGIMPTNRITTPNPPINWQEELTKLGRANPAALMHLYINKENIISLAKAGKSVKDIFNDFERSAK